MTALSVTDHDAETLAPDPGSMATELPDDAPTAAMSVVSNAMDAATLPRGSLLGRYAVLEVLGHGGMGVVYAAYDPDLDRRVAVKLLRTRGSDPERRAAGHARLLREAQAMARLVHPNVIHVYDVGSIDDAVFVAMEFIDGRTLKEEVADRRAQDGSNWRELLELYIAAGRGLAAAHEAGLVHRDFKPDNAMVTASGRVVVLDFGLAGAAGPATVSGEKLDLASAPSQSGKLGAPLTRTGAVLGTPAYMAPEQMMGQPVDARADQFSFCVALWEALDGDRPFGGDTFQELRANVLSGTSRPAKGNVPGWVRRALDRGLQTNPDERHASMAALLRELSNDPRRRRYRIIAGAVGVGALAAAWGAGVRLGGAADDPCADVGAAIDEVWTDARASEIRDAFEATGKAYSGDIADRVVPQLSTFARKWHTQRVEACTAAKVQRTQSDAVFDLRMACLDAALSRFDATVAMLAEADLRVATQAPLAVAKLPDLAMCADVELLRAEVPPPSDPVVRAEVDEIRRVIAAEVALGASGEMAAFGESIDELLPRARKLNYPAIEADLLYAKALHLGNNGQEEAARDAARQGLLLAEAAGDDQEVLRALLKLVEMESRLSNLARANDYLDHAEAVATRRGDRVGDRIDCLRTRGALRQVEREWEDVVVALEHAHDLATELGEGLGPDDVSWMSDLANAYYRLGRLDEAQRKAEEALELAHETLGPAHPSNMAILMALGRIARKRGQDDVALAYFEQGRELSLAALDPAHPNLGAMDNDIALTLKRMGRLKQAREVLEQGLAHARKVRGDKHLDTAVFLNNLGTLLTHVGEPAIAIPLLEEALRIKTEIHDADSPQIGFSMDNLGEALRRDGQLDRAVEVFEQARAFFERTGHANGSWSTFALTGLGAIALDRGEVDEAVRLLDRALVGAAESGTADYVRARARFAAARAVLAQGAADRAKSLATMAAQDYEEAGPEFALERAELEAWQRKLK